ncbi:lysoplasmalogenase [Actinoplanes bogorensis]|uniref:Lysoplasmalogenase n=1 Tax=Paractinoplanes bogorensis TaxID=1610840 RepID=A0ABS5YY83_9ACTN|nr:lysoplasmalogenase [Actinoplanes bogorensis]MBU2668281.1 lysoplasmalogenase [Actinoplanes bogorensis]
MLGAGLPLLLFAVAAVAEVIAVAADWTAVQWVAKPLLAPLLIWHLLSRSRPGQAVIVALGFAMAGDIALLVPGQAAFLVGMHFFLGTQISLIFAFVGWRRSRPARPGSARPYATRSSQEELSTGAASSTGGLDERPGFGLPRAGAAWVAPIGYGVLWVVANALLWGQLGALRLPVLVYSLALVTMAAAAAGVSRRVGIGGALFLVSDLLIGIGAAGLRVPGHDVVVMTTYAGALVLIVTGWNRRAADV